MSHLVSEHPSICKAAKSLCRCWHLLVPGRSTPGVGHGIANNGPSREGRRGQGYRVKKNVGEADLEKAITLIKRGSAEDRSFKIG